MPSKTPWHNLPSGWPRHVVLLQVCGLHYPPGQSLPSGKPFQLTLGLGKQCLQVHGHVPPPDEIRRGCRNSITKEVP